MLLQHSYTKIACKPLLHFTPSKPFFISSSQQNPHKPQTSFVETNPNHVFRKHNAMSTSLLIFHQTSQPKHYQENQENNRENNKENQETQLDSLEHSQELSESEKVQFLELSLVKRKTPVFPGSLLNNVDPTEIAPLYRLLKGGAVGVDNEGVLRRAVEIRREVTAEIFKECMRTGKFSINYASNLVVCIGEFIDYVMIEAAAMKGVDEFKHLTFNVRAKMCIEKTNVVPLIRWLKHNSMSYPQIGKLICMSCGNLELIRRTTEWLKTVYVKGDNLGPVLMKAGENILERSTEELDEIVQCLEKNGVKKEWMGFVITRCPKILSYTIEEMMARVSFYFEMGLNEKDFGTMVFESSKSLGFFTLEEMQAKVNYLKEFGLSTEDVGRLLAFKPQLMGCSIEERWKPLVKYLYYLGVRRDGMRRILTLKPMVFCVDLETTIVPKVRFLQDIGIREDAVGGVLVKFPHLLTYSLYKKIRPVVIFLITKAGVSQKNIGKVIALGPELLGCHIANKLDVNVKYFLSLGIYLRLLGEMVADFPLLLKYNPEILRPKYRYLRRTMMRPLKDLIEFPRFFSYSLEGRIIPRHKVMVERRINFKLRYMLACSDEEFNKKLETAVEKRNMFEAGIVNREKDVPDTTTSNPVEESQISCYTKEHEFKFK